MTQSTAPRPPTPYTPAPVRLPRCPACHDRRRRYVLVPGSGCAERRTVACRVCGWVATAELL